MKGIGEDGHGLGNPLTLMKLDQRFGRVRKLFGRYVSGDFFRMEAQFASPGAQQAKRNSALTT